jgi:hypothetical protein
MAKQNQSGLDFSLDRRQLLTAAAAATVAGVVPTEITEAATPAAAIEPAPLPVSHSPALNVCDATARRIEEITARNRIRQEAGLPLLSIPRELRKMKLADDLAEFEKFAAIHRQAVWDEVLAPVREVKGEPNWHPKAFMAGLGFQSKVRKILRERFAEQQQVDWCPPLTVGVPLRSRHLAPNCPGGISVPIDRTTIHCRRGLGPESSKGSYAEE